MPRTKRPVNKPVRLRESAADGGGESKKETLKRLDNLIAQQIKNIERATDMGRRSVELEFKIFIKTIPEKYVQMTVGQLKNEMNINMVDVPCSGRATEKSDDGYMTENSSHGSADKAKKKSNIASSASSRRASRRSRSADASARSRPPPSAARATTARRRSKSVYQTPARTNVTAYPPITPKVAPQTPMTLMRLPRQGEMVVSMQGSPVMVPTYSGQSQEKVNCGIVLADGTVLNVKPLELRQSQAYIPFSLMDPSVFNQIQTVKENLEKVMRLGQSHLMK